MATLPKREWSEMTWADFTAADTSRWIAVLPLAATEPHLPLGVDSFIADAYLARVRDLIPADLPVTFLPVQRIGQSDEHVAFPGTLTLSAATAIRAWTEIGESVARAGVKKLVLITSHGGNVETSLMLAGRRDTVRMEKAQAAVPATVGMAQEFHWLGAFRPAGFGWMTQDLHPSGTVGDASRATPEKGEAALAHGAKGFVELLREIDRFDLARLQDGPLKSL